MAAGCGAGRSGASRATVPATGWRMEEWSAKKRFSSHCRALSCAAMSARSQPASSSAGSSAPRSEAARLTAAPA